MREKCGGIPPDLAYARKMKRPPAFVERCRGACYELTVLYSIPGTSVSAPVVCYLSARDFRLLRQVRHRTVTVRPTAKHRKARRPPEIRAHVADWGYPDWLSDVLNDKGSTASPQEYAAGLLRMVIGTYLFSFEKLLVRAVRGSQSALFGVDIKSAPRFFADRGIELSIGGRKRPIFHAVVAHERVMANGKRVDVKPHYRGLRKFDWNGYGVSIALPWNNNVLLFPGASELVGDEEPRDGLVEPEAVAGRLALLANT